LSQYSNIEYFLYQEEPVADTEEEPVVDTEEEPVADTEEEPVADTEEEPVVDTEEEASGNVKKFTIVDTGQDQCYNSNGLSVSCSGSSGDIPGQDGTYQGIQPSYTDNGDGTVTDDNTGLVWQKSPDTDGDGYIDAGDKLTWNQAVAGAGTLTLGGFTDWRLPTIKELYSLIQFNGLDPSGWNGEDTSTLTPFIDTDYFDFAYGDTSAGERIIDAQYMSARFFLI